jgi:hypothetical protein
MQGYEGHILLSRVLYAKVLAMHSSLIDNDDLVKHSLMPKLVYPSFDGFGPDSESKIAGSDS